MRQLTFNDLFGDFITSLEDANEQSESDEVEDQPEDYPLIDQIITKFLKQHIKRNSLPTLQEAQTIATLDSIAEQYRA